MPPEERNKRKEQGEERWVGTKGKGAPYKEGVCAQIQTAAEAGRPLHHCRDLVRSLGAHFNDGVETAASLGHGGGGNDLGAVRQMK